MAAAVILPDAPSIAVTAEKAPMVGATLVTSAGISTSLPPESGVPGVSWTVVKNLSLFEHVR